jgi:hypothetical protein
VQDPSQTSIAGFLVKRLCRNEDRGEALLEQAIGFLIFRMRVLNVAVHQVLEKLDSLQGPGALKLSDKRFPL